MKIGAITLTSWARLAILTTSAWRMKELKNMPIGERVLEVVDLLEAACGRSRTRAAAAGAIPDVPLVVRDVDGARVRPAGLRRPGSAPPRPRCGGRCRARRPGSARSRSRGCRCRCGARCSRSRRRRRLEDGPVPADPVGVGAEVAGPGGDQLDGVVDAAHRLGGFEGELGVVLGVLVAQLPGAVDLVAEAPVLHAVRLVAAVLPALLRPVGVAGLVACTRPSSARPRSCRARR